jgi:(R,R)-butanediol dehydrogenase/meso-butanediol dehydrogenase/diacetyl reductase
VLMPAIRWHGRHDVRVEDVDVPEHPSPGMATVAVDVCGICGTDLAEYLHGPLMIRKDPHPLTHQAPPITLGHELVGRISALGEPSSDFAVGDRVTVDACWRCHRCFFCLNGDYHLCVMGGSIGLHSDGGLAPIVQVPDYTLVRVPAGVSDHTAALTEPLAVALHATDKADLAPGSTAVVVGFGPIGAGVAMLARLAGARVIVIEPLKGRQTLATRLGFDEVLDPLSHDTRREVRTRTRGLGADAVLDCTGHPPILPSSLELTRRGGTLVVVGLGNAPTELDANRIVLFERRIVGSLGYRRDLPRVLDLAVSHQLDVEALITAEVPLAEAVTGGLDLLAADPERQLKIVVRCS